MPYVLELRNLMLLELLIRLKKSAASGSHSFPQSSNQILIPLNSDSWKDKLLYQRHNFLSFQKNKGFQSQEEWILINSAYSFHPKISFNSVLVPRSPHPSVLGQGPHLTWTTVSDPEDPAGAQCQLLLEEHQKPFPATQREPSLSPAPPTHCQPGNKALGLPAEKTGEASRCHTWDNQLYNSRVSELVPVQTTSNPKARGDPLRSKSRQEQSKRMQAPLEMQGAMPLFHHNSDGSEGQPPCGVGCPTTQCPPHRLPLDCKQGLRSSHPDLPTHLTLLRSCLYPPALLKKINCI